MKATLNRLVKLLLGWSLVLLGIIGWFLPIFPGTPFIILGVAVLSAQSKWVRDKIESLRVRFPRQAAKLQALKEGLAARIRREGSP